MASAELHRAPLQVVCIADALDLSVEPVENRRSHERVRANDLHWLRGARIKYGADVRVLDISAGGMLLETSSELACDANLVVELIGPESPILVPSRVLRCRTASLGEILKYQGACVFKRPLSIPGLTARHVVRREAPVAQPPAAAPGVGWQKVIARFNDGRIVAGYTNNFHPSKQQLHLFVNPRQGESTFVPLAQLKALFFVREFGGDPTLIESKDFVDPPQGRKVEVTFHDNEIMVGSTLGYRAEGIGFFLHPADGRSNNLRVFVTAAGLKRMRFL
jgi:hypothetical protein